MKLSIVIVNYNVKYFLEQCLLSVQGALQGIEAEIFVVDNDSSDGSNEMLAEKFKDVILIANKKNVGFSVANNQAIRQAKGEFVLLLNPDTVVEENTFSECIQFMKQHPKAGALGVKMIDGKGNYLPESKRGLPTPSVSFYKIFGLSSLFPRSKRFAKYYLGHLSETENQEIEILAGAFMFMRNSALKEAGLLDEDFFMYGEDIDLSYRILKAGYANHYLASTSIIHYKGESTKKGSLNYVYVFYKAMAIFAKKHFSGTYAQLFNLLITLAIYLRAAISIVKRFVNALFLPVLDFSLLLGGLFYIKEYWEHNHRFIVGGEYSQNLIWTAFPLYALAWVLSLLVNGGYTKPTRLVKLFKGIFAGTVLILVIYSLVPEEFRFSRAIILLGSVWAAISIPLSRLLLQKLGKNLLVAHQQQKRIFIVGSVAEAERVEQLAKQTTPNISYLSFVSPNSTLAEHPKYVGTADNLPDMVRVFTIDEVIFCSKDISGNDIFKMMTQLNPTKVEIKIAPTESEFIIGSNSINSQGSWYTLQFNAISKPANRRAKRFFDISMALLLMITSPIGIWFTTNKSGFLGNIFSVLLAKKTWVGYDLRAPTSHLPKLKKSVLSVCSQRDFHQLQQTAVNHINQLYAKNYTAWNDLLFISRSFRNLGD